MPAARRTDRDFMPVYYVRKDLFESNADVLAHGCNCRCVMGAGIARHIKSTFPRAFLADRNDPRSPAAKLGSFSWTLSSIQRPIIANIYSQLEIGPDFRRSAFESALRALLKSMTREHLSSLAMPKIGCGIGGANWPEVKSIINTISSEFPNILISVHFLDDDPDTDPEEDESADISYDDCYNLAMEK